MELNLPIKYAIEPIYPYASNTGAVLGYIVSKCFIVGKTINFFPNGTMRELYTVVFPYKGLQTFKMMKNKRLPEFDGWGNYRNIDYTEHVYETYLEAREVCKDLNTSLFTSLYPCYQLDDMLKQFSDFEFKVLQKCSDMVITENDNDKVLGKRNRTA